MPIRKSDGKLRPGLVPAGLALLGLSLFTLTGCNTVSIPKTDLLEFPELQAEAEDIGDYPTINDAPDAPTDIRSAGAWDQAARDMSALKSAFSDIPAVAPLSDYEIDNEIQALASKARAYKLDDPPETYLVQD